jgi:hypothetical protein
MDADGDPVFGLAGKAAGMAADATSQVDGKPIVNHGDLS